MGVRVLVARLARAQQIKREPENSLRSSGPSPGRVQVGSIALTSHPEQLLGCASNRGVRGLPFVHGGRRQLQVGPFPRRAGPAEATGQRVESRYKTDPTTRKDGRQRHILWIAS
jgi:hypothetical protein